MKAVATTLAPEWAYQAPCGCAWLLRTGEKILRCGAPGCREPEQLTLEFK